MDPELIRARGGRGRAVERLAFAYLTRVRGEGRDLLAGLLEQRGVVSRAIRRSRWPGSNSRAAAASRLGLIASPEAAARLDQMATADRSMRVRIAAARGLGRTGTAEAAVALLSLLGPPDVVPEGVVASALLELGPGAAPALRRTLESGNPGGGHRRAMAADVLGLLAMMPAWEDLIRYVRDPELPVRVSAVRALGRLGVPRAADALSPCLAPGEDGELRAVAAHALGRIGDPHSAGPWPPAWATRTTGWPTTRPRHWPCWGPPAARRWRWRPPATQRALRTRARPCSTPASPAATHQGSPCPRRAAAGHERG